MRNSAGGPGVVAEGADDGGLCDHIDDGFTIQQCGEERMPAIWDCGMPLEWFVDVGMHMIFRGVTKDCIELMSGFMKDHKLETKFHEMINPFLLDIQAMRLDWCRVKPLPNTQWLAEDEMGLARIFPFVYGQFF